MATCKEEATETDNKLVEESSDIDGNLKVAHFLTSTFHVILNILSYLNARQLNSSARVCKLWNTAARTLKGKRRTRAWTFLTEDGKDIEGDEYGPIMHEYDKIITATSEFIQGLYTEPTLIFMYCSTELNEESVVCIQVNNPDGPNEEKTYPSYGDYVQSLIPPDCQLVAISTQGIVGTSSDLKHTYESEFNPSVSFLCLPDYPSFNAMCFKLDETDVGEDTMPGGNIIKQEIPDNAVCKGILSFIAEPDVPRSFVLNLKKDFVNTVLAGGIVDSLVPLEGEEGYPAAMHVALYGENVNVGCVVIRETIHTKEKAEEKIKDLKNYKLSEENSFAFMFACVGRGDGMWGEPTVETSLFQKHFPKTPIFGFFGNGEIGMDHVTTSSESSGPNTEPFMKKVKKNNKLFHSYTTIIVLVSLKS